MGISLVLVLDLFKTSPHLLTLGALLIVIVMIKMMFYEEDVILLFKRTVFFFKTLDMHIKIKLFKSYCSSIYGSELWPLEDDVLQDFCCSWRTVLRRLLNLPFDAHCFLLPILTGTLPVFDKICKRSSRFINSCLRSRYYVVRSVALHSIVHGKYYSPLGRNIRFRCHRFGWQLLQDFLLGFVSLNDDCFHNFCMNNIPVAQLQIAPLVEELLSLREGFVTFDCCNFLSKSDIIALLNAACKEWWRRVTSIEQFSLHFFFFCTLTYILHFLN